MRAGTNLAERRRQAEERAEEMAIDAAVVRSGVTLSWLATAFKMDARTVKLRLGDLQPIGEGARGAGVYDFGACATLLAKPPMEWVARHLKTMRVQDMPTHLQESYWGALRKKQIWEQNAGELWKTTDVLEVFSEVFKTLKSTVQLWVDNLDEDGDMAPEQRARLTEMVDGLLADMSAALLDMPRRRQTPSVLGDPDANPDSMKMLREDDAGPDDLIG